MEKSAPAFTPMTIKNKVLWILLVGFYNYLKLFQWKYHKCICFLIWDITLEKAIVD